MSKLLWFQGLICEGAEEFRETLVNPFSERFLWADSSPRGPTWSCADDVVLREKYERYPLKKKPSKLGDGTAKGLKLILLHSSQYRHISSAQLLEIEFVNMIFIVHFLRDMLSNVTFSGFINRFYSPDVLSNAFPFSFSVLFGVYSYLKSMTHSLLLKLFTFSNKP